MNAKNPTRAMVPGNSNPCFGLVSSVCTTLPMAPCTPSNIGAGDGSMVTIFIFEE